MLKQIQPNLPTHLSTLTSASRLFGRYRQNDDVNPAILGAPIFRVIWTFRAVRTGARNGEPGLWNSVSRGQQLQQVYAAGGSQFPIVLEAKAVDWDRIGVTDQDDVVGNG